MLYLITEIIICLLIAAIIGFIIGWLLRGLGCAEREAYQGAGFESGDVSSNINTFSSTPMAEDVVREPVTKSPVISHPIEEIEGIGKSLGKSLRNIGVKTTTDLLEKCSTEKGFQQAVQSTKVIDSAVTQWVSMADLLRIPDVTGQFAELMEASDVKSVKDLTQAEANDLSAIMQSVNQREHRIPDSMPLPDVNMIAAWIRDAKTIT